MTGHEPVERPDGPGEDPFREWDAAYVLGALGPTDRRLFEDHLAGCDACRGRVGDLAGLPGVLRALPADQAVALVAGPGPGPGGATGTDAGVAPVVELGAVARRARASRGRRRVALVASAAAVALVAGAGGACVGRSSAPQPVASDVARLELRPVGEVDVVAQLTLEPKGWGTRLDWSCEYPSGGPYDGPAPVYELVLVQEDGTSTVAATWSATAGHARDLGASSSVPADDIARVEIRLEGARDALASALT